MKFSDYQRLTEVTAVYPRPFNELSGSVDPQVMRTATIVPIMYCALGLTGEAGEVAEQVKKSWRNDMAMTQDRADKIEDELGDVLWYTSQLANELNMDLDVIASKNITKLQNRRSKGDLKHA